MPQLLFETNDGTPRAPWSPPILLPYESPRVWEAYGNMGPIIGGPYTFHETSSMSQTLLGTAPCFPVALDGSRPATRRSPCGNRNEPKSGFRQVRNITCWGIPFPRDIKHIHNIDIVKPPMIHESLETPSKKSWKHHLSMNAVQDGHGLMDATKKKACNNWGNLGNISIPLMMDTNGMYV